MVTYLKSIRALLAGVIVMFVISAGLKYVFTLAGFTPDLGQIMRKELLSFLPIACYIVAVIAGGFVTAFLAPRSACFHAFLLGCIGIGWVYFMVITLLHGILLWYPITLFIVTIPSALLGAYLRKVLK